MFMPEGEELLEMTINSVKEIVGNIEKPGIGIMFTIPGLWVINEKYKVRFEKYRII